MTHPNIVGLHDAIIKPTFGMFDWISEHIRRYRCWIPDKIQALCPYVIFALTPGRKIEEGKSRTKRFSINMAFKLYKSAQQCPWYTPGRIHKAPRGLLSVPRGHLEKNYIGGTEKMWHTIWERSTPEWQYRNYIKMAYLPRFCWCRNKSNSPVSQ